VPKNPATLADFNHRLSLPKAPANLGKAGTSLWRRILSEYDIADSGGLELLAQICFAAERAERLRMRIDADGEIVVSERGMREHPGLKAELMARSFVVRSLQRLGINLEAIRPASGTRPHPTWSASREHQS
jgi:hypothetical protein